MTTGISNKFRDAILKMAGRTSMEDFNVAAGDKQLKMLSAVGPNAILVFFSGDPPESIKQPFTHNFEIVVLRGNAMTFGWANNQGGFDVLPMTGGTAINTGCIRFARLYTARREPIEQFLVGPGQVFEFTNYCLIRGDKLTLNHWTFHPERPL